MALPFDLPALTRGYAELGREARRVGERAAAGAAGALARLLGCEVTVEGRALPAAGPPGLGCGRLGLQLGAVPGGGALDVDAGLVAQMVDRLAGGPGGLPGATSLTPLEQSALELFALAALDGACGEAPEIDERLAPRLLRTPVEAASPLVVDLRVSCGPASGRARLLLPPGAVRALRGETGDGELPPGPCLPASLRSGWTELEPGELDALARGDVVLLLEPPGTRQQLVLPGGFTAAGSVEGDSLHVEETRMAEPRSRIPVTLEVELARFPVPVGDLARLEAGSVLALPVDRRGLVTLRAGEQAVAHGELVDLDGAVGVRILSLEGRP
jgi:type III secretion protein Q